MYTVAYSAEDGGLSERMYRTLGEACDAASALAYRSTGADYAGFPYACDTYTWTTEEDGRPIVHTLTIAPTPTMDDDYYGDGYGNVYARTTYTNEDGEPTFG